MNQEHGSQPGGSRKGGGKSSKFWHGRKKEDKYQPPTEDQSVDMYNNHSDLEFEDLMKDHAQSTGIPLETFSDTIGKILEKERSRVRRERASHNPGSQEGQPNDAAEVTMESKDRRSPRAKRSPIAGDTNASPQEGTGVFHGDESTPGASTPHANVTFNMGMKVPGETDPDILSPIDKVDSDVTSPTKTPKVPDGDLSDCPCWRSYGIPVAGVI